MKFLSRWKEHRIVIKPAYYREVDSKAILVQGKAIQFHDNEFITEDQEEIDFLKKHREFGTIIHEVPSGDEINAGILKIAEEIEQKKSVKFKGDKEEVFKCDVCGFIAKSKIGLTAHKKTHK